METGRQVGNKRTQKRGRWKTKKKRIPTKTYQKNEQQRDRKKWCRSCLTQENAQKRQIKEDKTKRREDEDGKHRK